MAVKKAAKKAAAKKSVQHKAKPRKPRPKISGEAARAEVSRLMKAQADRGIFGGFSEVKAPAGKALFRIVWHRGREFDIAFDMRSATLSAPAFLPNVKPGSELEKNFRAFLKEHGADRRAHRRLDPKKLAASVGRRGKDLALNLKSLDGDFAYAVQRLLHLIHETQLVFLADGIYYQYRVEELGADPDFG